MIETLPPNERYSYVFDGNSQALDHILVSANLLNDAALRPAMTSCTRTRSSSTSSPTTIRSSCG